MKHSIAALRGDLKATFGLVWFVLHCSKAKQRTESGGYDHMRVSQGFMRTQHPLLMAPHRPQSVLGMSQLAASPMVYGVASLPRLIL